MYIVLAVLLLALGYVSGVEQNTCDCTCMCSPKVDIFIPPSSGVVTTHGTVPHPIATVTLRDCPADFYMLNHTCYYVTPPTSDAEIDDVSELCSAKNDNSALVTVNSATEFNFITRKIINKKFPVAGLYLTGGRGSKSGAWYWQRTGARLTEDVLELMSRNSTVLPDYCIYIRTTQPAVLIPLPCQQRYHMGAVCDIPLP